MLLGLSAIIFSLFFRDRMSTVRSYVLHWQYSNLNSVCGGFRLDGRARLLLKDLLDQASERLLKAYSQVRLPAPASL